MSISRWSQMRFKLRPARLRFAGLGLGLIILSLLVKSGVERMQPPLTPATLNAYLQQVVTTEVPGLQYVVVTASGPRLTYAGGWADVAEQQPMTPDTTLMAFSMTKTFTAVAVLQLVEQGRLGLEDELDDYLPATPYAGQHLTVRQLLAHTAGLPNPIPLRWVHAPDDADFDETAALAAVMAANDQLASAPGERFAYSNLGYWLLGPVVERVTGQPFVDYVRAEVLAPLGLSAADMDFVIPAAVPHATGYLARYSWLNVFKGFLTEPDYWGSYAGNWLEVKPLHLNGPAFGGLVGSASAFGRLLQDQLQPQSVVLGPAGRQWLETQQTDAAGAPIPMTLGWHVGELNGEVYFYKEGGGGGFHTEMRLYPSLGLGTVVMVNSTEFNSTAFLDRADRAFWDR